MSCPSYIKTKPVPICGTSLIIGSIPDASTDVKIFIAKANGSKYTQETTSDAAGLVTMDLTDPDTAHYIGFDGLYLISVGTDLNDLKAITIDTEANTVVGVTFSNYKNNTVAAPFTLEVAA